MRGADDARDQELPRAPGASQRRPVPSGLRGQGNDVDPEERHKHAKSDKSIGHGALRNGQRRTYLVRCYDGIRKSGVECPENLTRG